MKKCPSAPVAEGTPQVDPSAVVTESELGLWCAIDTRVHVAESILGDCTYVTHDTEINYSRIGKFFSIAAFARINPGNHPRNSTRYDGGR
jgi:bifunctional N-acetylglucosamine-1-phosphate-uridyltransferase/glucosamine-1-phosphate-acetyltransferase GlmU-like protein